MPESLVEPVPVKLPRGYISFSQVSGYQNCPEKYRLQYIEDAPSEPSGAALAGSAVHAVIAQAEQEGWWLEGRAEPMYAAFARDFGDRIEAVGGPDAIKWGGRKTKNFPQGEDMLWWAHTGPVMLDRYAALRQKDAAEGAQILPGDVEREVGVLLDVPGRNEKLLVRGFLDALVLVDPNGQAVIRDYKTGSWMAPEQLGLYAFMLGKADPPLNVDVGELVKLRQPKIDSMIARFNLAPWVPVMETMLLESVQGIESGFFPMRPGMLCPSCGVRSLCSWGATLGE
jgi:hypothetical protein